MKEGKLFIVSAPSGAGKTTLIEELLKRWGKKYNLERAITYTTRNAREGEINGVDYNFISIEEFQRKIEEGFFIEWSTWYDHFYGSSIEIIKGLKNGVSYILIVDRLGASKIVGQFPGSILIWITPPSLSVLEQRLRLRAKDSETTILNRLKKAAIEIEEENQNHLYNYHFINDNFENTLENIKKIFKLNLKI
ncbi:guanylate kinase [bacterium]|nr:guanylate kinase [bacterium]